MNGNLTASDVEPPGTNESQQNPQGEVVTANGETVTANGETVTATPPTP